jgi:hypothetical protein
MRAWPYAQAAQDLEAICDFQPQDSEPSASVFAKRLMSIIAPPSRTVENEPRRFRREEHHRSGRQNRFCYPRRSLYRIVIEGDA